MKDTDNKLYIALLNAHWVNKNANLTKYLNMHLYMYTHIVYMHVQGVCHYNCDI